MKRTVFVISFFLSLLLMCNCKQDNPATYAIAANYAVEGDGFWDYLVVDEKTDRLFVSHANVTQILNTTSGKLLHSIQNTQGVHGIALDHGSNKAYISCGKDSTVAIINLNSLELLAKVKTTGANPDAILYDPYSDRVFAYNAGSSNATVIDAKTDSVITTIALPGSPEFSVSDGMGKVYVNIEDKSLVAVIDSKNLTVENSWSLSPGEEPSGLAIDTASMRLFAVCGNKKMVVMNANNGEIVATLAIGEGSDGCMFDPGSKRIYSSNGEGTLTVVQQINKDNYQILTTVKTQIGARTLAINTKTHQVYLPTAKFGEAPKPTADNPHPWPTILPGTFSVLVIAPN